MLRDLTANPFDCERPSTRQILLPRSRMTDRLGVSNRTSRRRGTLKRFSTVNNGTVGQTGGRRPPQENRSETSDNRPKRVSLHVENTYRMRPSSEERFSVTKMETLMSEILDNRLRDTTYNGETCSELAKELVCTIIAKTKEFQWQRYKLVAQVHVGQNDSQAVQVASRCIWDPSFDSYACVSYKNTSLFVVASCYGIYFE
ncbi:dynein light chain Tctex-type 5-B-like [Haliotis rufescens]|uniref:dynein light chain Tctex-type 5-B-like n=1 Tax=Haliotis rufescens TaxID=6454 RepID=UPI00201EB774|nr:dynein light chain Tctex-type 5-B-like [Haliotis rufescens]